MRKIFLLFIPLLLLAACQTAPVETIECSSDIPPDELNSHYYIDGVSIEDIIMYFDEVCLQSEYATGAGDARLIQKWTEPVYYHITGNPTDEDLTVIEDMANQLNRIDGFPGFYPSDESQSSLEISFCLSYELINRLGENFTENEFGGATYWYNDADNIITNGIICCRSDIDQQTRNSVIKEEIYNILGPSQDTQLRTDSIIYQHSDENLNLSQTDFVILQILYHPEIECGMNYEQCAAVIHKLYYK